MSKFEYSRFSIAVSEVSRNIVLKRLQ